jgi:predicted TIM-barrel fold metal-dependent hydrolase
MTTPWMVDVHTHLFPDWMQKNRWDYVERDNVFKEIYGDEKARMATADEIVRTMDEENVAVSVVFGFPWADQGINRDHNDYILGAAGRYPDRLVPFACLNPLAPGAGEETARCIEKGARGVGEIAFYDRVIDEEVIDHLRPVLEILKDANLPLLIHTNEPVGHIYPGKSMKNLTEIELLVKSFPENTFILAHWGGGIFFFELMKELKALFRNVYYDTAASPFLYQPEIYIVAGQIIGFDRILLGTDYPLIRPQRYLKQISETVHDDEKVRMVCRGNALRLLNLQEKAL